MNILLTYSSKTGNTKKLAEAIYEVMPEGADFFPMGKVENIDKYDVIILGCWIDKGLPNQEALKFIDRVKSKQIGYFFTLGAYTNSKHAKDCHNRIAKLLTENENTVVSNFCCQGKIDPALTEKFKSLPKGHPHYMNEERIKRHNEAAKHPNEDDFKKAKEIFRICLA